MSSYTSTLSWHRHPIEIFHFVRTNTTSDEFINDIRHENGFFSFVYKRNEKQNLNIFLSFSEQWCSIDANEIADIMQDTFVGWIKWSMNFQLIRITQWTWNECKQYRMPIVIIIDFSTCNDFVYLFFTNFQRTYWVSTQLKSISQKRH